MMTLYGINWTGSTDGKNFVFGIMARIHLVSSWKKNLKYMDFAENIALPCLMNRLKT